MSEQAPKSGLENELFVYDHHPFHEVWDYGETEVVNGYRKAFFKKDHARTTAYIRADRVELMVKLAELEQRVKYVQGTLGTERDAQSWISEIIKLKEQLQ